MKYLIKYHGEELPQKPNLTMSPYIVFCILRLEISQISKCLLDQNTDHMINNTLII